MLTFKIESLCSLEKVKGERAHYIVDLSHTMSINLCPGDRYSLRKYCNIALSSNNAIISASEKCCL